MGIIKKDDAVAYSVGDRLYCIDCFASESDPEKGRAVTMNSLEKEEIERFCGVCRKMIFPGRLQPASPPEPSPDGHGKKQD